MTAWILLFRGVGGATQLPVKDLRAALEAEGFERVATYINSGNAVLASPLDREGVHAGATRAAATLGFAKDIHVVSLAEWEEVAANSPFPEHGGKLVHAVWLAGAPDPERVVRIRAEAVEGEAFEVVGRAAYILAPHGFGTSKLPVAFDRLIGVKNTARNWNTVEKLLEMARERA